MDKVRDAILTGCSSVSTKQMDVIMANLAPYLKGPVAESAPTVTETETGDWQGVMIGHLCGIEETLQELKDVMIQIASK